ncbi:helix-turn-helix domain-containing protein [[Clostridium] fimetarium]|uniref:DNA-binding transcriptional regulator, XRE-family HTH domain n=1 Tax=[Clostridium] fimetarium TaxID=99656 RepID=A0A1I0MB23_9FIRM|nr:helix-turn-helix transcriptional regulator [[Clostridium] fimetarium]SEV85492.1 DNA-binding transcriptional regulator, XRE-family HTH domain [[Clostridium] fimetarium]
MKYFDAEQIKIMGERIKNARIKSGLTQREVADELGVTSEMVIRIEKGKSACKTDHIFILCQLFNISADYLLYEKKMQEEKIANLKLDNMIDNLLQDVDEFEKNKIFRIIQLMLEKQPS